MVLSKHIRRSSIVNFTIIDCPHRTTSLAHILSAIAEARSALVVEIDNFSGSMQPLRVKRNGANYSFIYLRRFLAAQSQDVG